MIQRFQSLFFLFASIILIMIIYQFPILESESVSYYLSNHFSSVRLLVLFSAALSFFSIFQFRNTKRQKMISNIARLLITIALVLIVFVYKEDKNIGLGLFLLIIPFIFLLIANFLIRKDEKLIESSDRIR